MRYSWQVKIVTITSGKNDKDRPRPEILGQITFAAWKLHFAAPGSIHEDCRIRIQVLHREPNTPPGPFVGHPNCPLVPRRRDVAETLVFPARMRVNGLKIFLHVIGDSRPATGNFEVAPFGARDLLPCN